MKTEASDYIDIKAILHIDLDKKWQVYDMIDLFTSIQKLYDLYSIFYIINRTSFLDKHWDEQTINSIGFLSLNIFDESTSFIDRYNKRYVFKIQDKDQIRLELLQPLTIKSIEFSSPGILEILGAAGIFVLIKDLIFKSIDLYKTKKIEKEKLHKLALENKLLELEVIKKYAELLQGVGIDEDQVKKLISHQAKSLEIINRFIEEDKIKAIK